MTEPRLYFVKVQVDRSGGYQIGRIGTHSRRILRLCLILLVATMSGCSGIQSALDPAGREAEWLAEIFWVMTAGAVIIWIGVIALALWAVRTRPEAHSLRRTRLLIVGGGAVIPTIVLAILLLYGLRPIPILLAPAPEGSLKVYVTGEQWWWRIRYETPNGTVAVLANEIRLPVGQPVQFQLDSPDVIHSFWIPSLAGKVDMIPGRTTYLSLMPTRTGVFRGACAEYCGASHALMAFAVVVTEAEEFQRWIEQQASPAKSPVEPVAIRGSELFLANGCSACHTIRGTPADGVVGPDLTHVGSRLTIGAATLPTDPAAFHRWIAHTHQVKPDVLMPSFDMLPEEELIALTAYLRRLE